MSDYVSKYTGEQIDDLLDEVNAPDSTPTTGSQHLVTSGGVKSALNGKAAQSDMEAVEGKIPSGATSSNKLVTQADIANFVTASVNNLVNYYLKSETYTKTEVDNIIGTINQFHYEIYASTSAVTNPQSNVLYLIGPTGSGADKYEEYVYTNSTWAKIGDTSIDLSGYVTTTALNTALANYAPKTWVSVSQNTSTGHTDINIGSDSYPVASVEEVSQLGQEVFGFQYPGFIYPVDGSDLSQGFLLDVVPGYSFVIIRVVPGAKYTTQNVGRKVFLSAFDYDNPSNIVAATGETWESGDISVNAPADAKYLYILYASNILVNDIPLPCGFVDSVPRIEAKTEELSEDVAELTTDVEELSEDVNNTFIGRYIGYITPKDNSDLSQGFNLEEDLNYSFIIIHVTPGVKYTTQGVNRRVFLSEFDYARPSNIVAATGETWESGDISVNAPADAKYLYCNGFNITINNIKISNDLFASLSECAANKRVSILGDSYGTYKGYVTPEANRCFYADEGVSDLTDVSQTWWYKIIQRKKYILEYNNSYSGSPVCTTGYEGTDATTFSFVTRMKNIGRPDVIFIFGGTNDSWAEVPIGSYQYSGWTENDLKSFRPAYAYMLDYLISHNPNAKIYSVTNSGLSSDITQSIATICEHYGITNIALSNIDQSYGGHPGVYGMNQIYTQIMDVIH